MKAKTVWWIPVLAWTIIVTCVVAGVGLGSWIWMLLWNFALVPLFHAPKINFWQALAISSLLSTVGGYFKNASK